jgi:hypothetical protein
MNVNTIKEKLNNEISKINVEKIKNDAQKYGYKAALTAVEFGSKAVQKVEVFLKKDATPTKDTHVDEVSIEVEIYPKDKSRKKINRKRQAKTRTIIIRK